MKALEPENYNLVMGAGNNPNTHDLKVSICHNNSIAPGHTFIVSKWEFSKEELEEIQRTGCMYISTMGSGMSPIMPFVYKPKEQGFIPLQLYPDRQ